MLLFLSENTKYFSQKDIWSGNKNITYYDHLYLSSFFYLNEHERQLKNLRITPPLYTIWKVDRLEQTVPNSKVIRLKKCRKKFYYFSWHTPILIIIVDGLAVVLRLSDISQCRKEFLVFFILRWTNETMQVGLVLKKGNAEAFPFRLFNKTTLVAL